MTETIMDKILHLLPWVLPPLLGAFIGYVTNSIAIAMIFRPHRQYRFLGLPVPFTPGIIPKQRLELSQSIGKMVSRELLTEDAVRKQTGSSVFTEGLLRGIETSTGSLFSTPLGELLKSREAGGILPAAGEGGGGGISGDEPGSAIAPTGNGSGGSGPGSTTALSETSSGPGQLILSADGGSYSAGGNGAGNTLLSLAGRSFLEGQGFPLLIKEAVSKALAYAEGIPVDRFFPTQESRERAVSKLLELVSSPDLAEKVKTWVIGWISGHREKNTPLSSIISEGDLERFVSLLDTLYPGLRVKLFEYLDKREVRGELEKKGRRLLRSALDRFSSFQRFFIMAGQFDRNLDENMGALVADVIKALRETADKEETLTLLKNKTFEKLNQFRETGVGEIFDRFPKLEEKIGTGIEAFFRFIKRPGVGEALTSGLSGLERYQRETLGSLAESLFKIRIRDWEASISGFILDRKKTGNLGDYLSPFVEGFLQKNAVLTLGEFLGFDGEKKGELDRQLCLLLTELINKKIPEILASVNIQELVKDKIDSLDIKKMETLILEVVAKQLRWINIFGGFLGAIIGMSQVVLRLLGI